MSVSVIGSARSSTASLFDFVGSVANVSNQLVTTAARAVDALDSKAQLMHRGVISNTRAQLVNLDNREIASAACEHADFMETIAKRTSPNTVFDWTDCYNAAVAEITIAVKQE
jgi:hypothetical protein